MNMYKAVINRLVHIAFHFEKQDDQTLAEIISQAINDVGQWSQHDLHFFSQPERRNIFTISYLWTVDSGICKQRIMQINFLCDLLIEFGNSYPRGWDEANKVLRESLAVQRGWEQKLIEKQSQEEIIRKSRQIVEDRQLAKIITAQESFSARTSREKVLRNRTVYYNVLD